MSRQQKRISEFRTYRLDAWALLMPEADMVTVMHNAKFDLSVLNRTGLPLPEEWECAQIASHLLNETGEPV
jgi:ribonuclease D